MAFMKGVLNISKKIQSTNLSIAGKAAFIDGQSESYSLLILKTIVTQSTGISGLQIRYPSSGSLFVLTGDIIPAYGIS